MGGRVGGEQGSDSCYLWEVGPVGFPKDGFGRGEAGRGMAPWPLAEGGASFPFLAP